MHGEYVECLKLYIKKIWQDMYFFKELNTYPKSKHYSSFSTEFCAKVRIFYHFYNRYKPE